MLPENVDNDLGWWLVLFGNSSVAVGALGRHGPWFTDSPALVVYRSVVLYIQLVVLRIAVFFWGGVVSTVSNNK